MLVGSLEDSMCVACVAGGGGRVGERETIILESCKRVPLKRLRGLQIPWKGLILKGCLKRPILAWVKVCLSSRGRLSSLGDQTIPSLEGQGCRRLSHLSLTPGSGPRRLPEPAPIE